MFLYYCNNCFLNIVCDKLSYLIKHEKEYLEILAAVKGSDKEKRLASQFIAKFFNSFPTLSEQAIEAQFDLCEDDDVAVSTNFSFKYNLNYISNAVKILC